MPLGWIDFSKGQRNKVLNVLELLGEKGTLDELGIAPARDGFANLFFPGTSTIQTRAKYFMIVPYALKDLEYGPEANPNRLLQLFDEMEKSCGEQFLADDPDTSGIIGSRSLRQGKWVKRTPADIYWAGLRNYGIFTGGNLSLTEYVRAMCAVKQQKTTLSKLGNRHDSSEERDTDDKDAGDLSHVQFWKIPTYKTNWTENLDITLSSKEGAFLKQQIMAAFPDSMMAYILKNDMTEVLQCGSFQQLDEMIRIFPKEIQQKYQLALDFSDFIYVLRVLYNRIISDDQNETANEEWEVLQDELTRIAAVDLEHVISELHLKANVFLCNFLLKSQMLMRDGDIESLRNEIKRRERELKQGRAKTMHPGEFDPEGWYGGRQLDYRFSNARTIIEDIFESEGIYAKSK